MTKASRRLKKRWNKSFIRYERNLSIIVAIGGAIYLERVVGADQVQLFLEEQRMLVFPVMSTLFGALLGLVIAAATIAVERLSSGALPVVVESGRSPDLGRVFNSALVALGLATLASLVLVIPANEGADRFLLYLWIWVVLLAAARVARVVWVVSQILKIETKAPGSAWD